MTDFYRATMGHQRTLRKPISKARAEKRHETEFRGWTQSCACGWEDARLKIPRGSSMKLEPLENFENRWYQHLMDVYRASKEAS